jgi:hypothetical protein
MNSTHVPCLHTCDLESPTRNNYFYGKLLDVYHFNLETEYFNYKRRLLNRLVTGYGVVCGLDVTPYSDGAVIVKCGLAIDRHGNEVIVDQDSRPIPIPGPPPPKPPPGTPQASPSARQGPVQSHANDSCGDDEGHWHHLVLCYHECKADPTPVMTSECNEHERCQPGVIRERYKLELRPGRAPGSPGDLYMQPPICDGRIDYEALVKFVTCSGCQPCPDDPCIPLADICATIDPDSGRPRIHVHIEVRPIVYTNDLLYQLLLCQTSETKHRPLK